MSMIKRRIEKNESTMDGTAKWWMPDIETMAYLAEEEEKEKKEKVRRKKREEAAAQETFVGRWRDKQNELVPDVLVNIGNKRAYTITAKIGQGGFSTVFLATREDEITHTQWTVALKVISIAEMEKEKSTYRIANEVVNHQSCCLNNKHVLQCYEMFRTTKHYCFVLEYASGNMNNIFRKKKHMATDEVRRIFSQMTRAVASIHQKNIIHHDIKPDNFLLVGRGDDFTIKLADFGFSRLIPKSNLCFDTCGTPRYVAPEIASVFLKLTLNDGHTKAVDIWALGYVLYMLATGKYPIIESTDPLYEKSSFEEKYYHALLEQPIVYPPNMEPTLQDLLKKMLERDPLKRITAEQVLAHDFFTFIIEKDVK